MFYYWFNIDYWITSIWARRARYSQVSRRGHCQLVCGHLVAEIRATTPTQVRRLQQPRPKCMCSQIAIQALQAAGGVHELTGVAPRTEEWSQKQVFACSKFFSSLNVYYLYILNNTLPNYVSGVQFPLQVRSV